MRRGDETIHAPEAATTAFARHTNVHGCLAQSSTAMVLNSFNVAIHSYSAHMMRCPKQGPISAQNTNDWMTSKEEETHARHSHLNGVSIAHLASPHRVIRAISCVEARHEAVVLSADGAVDENLALQ